MPLVQLRTVPGFTVGMSPDEASNREAIIRWHARTWAGVLVILAAGGDRLTVTFPAASETRSSRQ